MAHAISFGQLVGLMVAGNDEPDLLHGEIRSIEDGVERRYRVWRRGTLSREEDLDGTVLDIVGQDAQWHRDADTGELWIRPHERDVDALYANAPIGGLEVGGPRPSWERWTGTDFTRPTGPVEPIEFVGRRAWAIELAPPAHKPHPMQLIIDADIGIVLRTANAAFGWFVEWVELKIGAELPDELFTWDGPASSVPSRDELHAEFAAEESPRQAWLAARGVTGVTLRIAPEVRLHRWDDATGAFYASLDMQSSATLIRRPRSPEPWRDPDTTNYPRSRRWSDDRWDWFLASEHDIGDDDFVRLRARLATTS